MRKAKKRSGNVKKVIYNMFNTIGNEEEVIFEIKPLQTRWEFTEMVSKAKMLSGGDEFKLAVEMAKLFFPKMIVSPEFPIVKKMDGVEWNIETQIKEFFINDPEILNKLVMELMGLMKVQRSK